jgi:outer membrane protein OmpA-like peptidoglycan-associated protein
MNTIYLFVMKSIKYFILNVLILTSVQAFPQINLKEKIKNQSNNRANERVDQGIDREMNKMEEGIGNIFRKKEKPENPGEESGNEAGENKDQGDGSQTEETTNRVTEGNTDSPKPQDRIQSYTRYDFVPGDKILFFEDFSQDAVGDFPAMWTTNGSGEIRTLASYPGNWLYALSDEHVYCLMKDLELPQNFILEFDVLPEDNPDNEEQTGFYLTFFNSQEDFLNDELYPGNAGFHVVINNGGWSAYGYKDQESFVASTSEINPIKANQLSHIILWVQNRRIRIYHEGKKIIDGPSALPVNTSYNRFRFSMWGQTGHPFFSNLKITTAAPDTRSKLVTEGKLISYGISFDSGKDIVRPESYGALNDIARVLKENPELKIRITGHTDSDGNDALNLDLSKRRALSVKNELTSTFGIDPSRMETEGRGESQPLGPNDSAEGKARNRRVEFTKL